MTESTSGLQHAETRLEQAQGALDAIGRVLDSAEKTRVAADRARTAVRSGNMLVFAALAALGVLLLIQGKCRG
jgi:hypothetical protein